MDNHHVKAVPQVPIHQLSIGNRALGKLVDIQLPQLEDKQLDQQASWDLAGDLFWRQFRGDGVSVRDPVPNERMVNQRLIDWIAETGGEKFKANRGNLPASKVATELLWQNAMRDEVIQEAMKAQQEYEDAEAEKMAHEQQRDQKMESGDEAGARKHEAEINKLAMQMQNQLAEMDARTEQATTDQVTRATVVAAAKAAAEKADEVRSMMIGFGLGPHEAAYEDPAAAQKFLSLAQGHIAEIAKIAGRIRGFALTAHRSRVRVGPVSMQVGPTKNPLKLFPTEAMKLGKNAPRLTQFEARTRFLSDGLTGWLPVEDGEKEGPFVAGIDVSGSMSGARIIVAKGVALGLAQAARETGREFILFAFASDRSKLFAVTSNDDWSEVIRWCGMAASGGTDFDMAMEFAIEKLHEMSQVDRADFLFISDGEGYLSPARLDDWLNHKTEHGARLFYVPVVAQYPQNTIVRIADKVIHLTDFDEKAGTKLAESVASHWGNPF